MARYITARALQTIPVLFLASVAVFLVLRLVPGDPAASLAGNNATPADIARIRHQLGIDTSYPQQYLTWLGDLAHGDLGTSFQSGLSVNHLLALAFLPTVELTVAGFLVGSLVGVLLGVMAELIPNPAGIGCCPASQPSRSASPASSWECSFCSSSQFGCTGCPRQGQVNFFDNPTESLRYLVLPAIALGTSLAAVLGRYTGTAVSEVMRQDFVRTARAKGLPERSVVFRHALRSALVPVIKIAALQVGRLLAGAIVIEQVFTRPGLGRLLLNAILNRNYLVVQSALVILVVVFVFVNLVADITYGVLDPRVRFS